jgi:hypothetical protein
VQTKAKFRARRIMTWLRDTWAEMDYAQRRLVELRTGIPALGIARERADIDELEAVYALPPREPEHGLD